MKANIYAVYDVKAAVYNHPFFVSTHGIATRGFTDMASNPETDIGKHPEDYTLFCIGEWDDNNGHIESITPENMGNGLEFKAIRMQDQNRIVSLKEEISQIQNGEDSQPPDPQKGPLTPVDTTNP